LVQEKDFSKGELIMRQLLIIPAIAAMTFGITNCGDSGTSFSLGSDQDTFQQSAGTVNDKIDILWVVDNSGSMESSQTNLGTNFSSFISGFSAKNLDYRMAFTTTDAYRHASNFANNQNCAVFRDRVLSSTCNNVGGYNASGTKIITPSVPGAALLNGVFTSNATTGIFGSGDERAFQSLTSALTHPANAGYNFLRDDSFFAVIILSDEDDFSHNGTTNKGIYPPNYGDPALHPVSQYITALDGITNSSGVNRRYTVNAITILDETCRANLNTSFGGRQIGVRYSQLVDLTGGMKKSLCGNFAQDLTSIADYLLTLATQFYLSRIPKPETIVVTVNGTAVPNRNTNPAGNGGWDYDSVTNSIKFYGSAYIPPSGAVMSVNYDPVSYGQ
jgi:hypothetical protein